MSNLLQSKTIDTTPQGSKPTTIIQKIIEICKDGSEATRTGADFGHIKSHQNSVFTYKGNPATYVSEAEGIFTFAVLDISGDAPVAHTYTVDADKKITQGEDVEFGGGGSGAITEKTVTIRNGDGSVGTIVVSTGMMMGEELAMYADETAEGGIFHNARITGIDAKLNGEWMNGYALANQGAILVLPQIPTVLNLGDTMATVLAFTSEATGVLNSVTEFRFHYYEIAEAE